MARLYGHAIVIGASMGGLLAARAGRSLRSSHDSYITKLCRAAQRDAVLAARFLEVANLTRQPQALLDPRIALRVWKGYRRPVQAAATPAVQRLG
jgi:alpha-beta hydrolase superfamily lysophospholipase